MNECTRNTIYSQHRTQADGWIINDFQIWSLLKAIEIFIEFNNQLKYRYPVRNVFQSSLKIAVIDLLWFLPSACSFRFCICFVKCLPKCFIFFGVIIIGTIVLISVSAGSFLVYRNVISFHVLTLYPAILLTSFVSSWRIYWGGGADYMEFFYVDNQASANRKNFLSFQPICLLLPFLPYCAC